MGIPASGVNNATPAASTSANTMGSSSQEIQDSFLKLFIAQMQNQDPTNPMDNSQLTSQLAQISSLSSMEKLNTTLSGISEQIDTGHTLQATSLIGRAVMIDGDQILVGRDVEEVVEGTDTPIETGNIITTPFGINLIRAADEVTVTIKDKNGVVVRKVDLGPMNAGINVYSWDGLTDDGLGVDDGSYSFSVTASYDKQAVVASTLSYAQIYGVTNSAGGVKLDLGLSGTKSLDDIRQVL